MAAPPRITITVGSGVSTLQIQAVDDTDTGDYRCIATNDAATVTRDLLIEVNPCKRHDLICHACTL